jgi:coenzyme PQQ precursor peptide PqqA
MAAQALERRKGTMAKWQTPEFEEIETSAEVTAYAAHWE